MLYASIGVIIGVTTIVAILTTAVAGKAKLYSQLDKYGANLIVMPVISDIDMRLGGLRLGTLTVGNNYISEEKLPQIRQVTDDMIKKALHIKDEGEFAIIAPKLYMNTEVRGTSVMVVGIYPQEENKLKPWWKVSEGRYLENLSDALVGALAAKLLKFNIGDKIILNGKAEVTVAGVLEETGSDDDYQLFISMKTAQSAFDKKGLLSSIDIRAICSGCPVEEIVTAIHESIPGVRAIAVKQIAETEMGMLEKISKFLLTLSGIAVAIGCFGVANTMMTSVHERIKDIGIMKAVGASRNQINKIFLYEAIIVGIVGGIFGYGAGTLLAYILGPLIFEGAAITYVPLYFPLSLILATFVAVIATVYPAYQASKIKVADSFRSL